MFSSFKNISANCCNIIHMIISIYSPRQSKPDRFKFRILSVGLQDPVAIKPPISTLSPHLQYRIRCEHLSGKFFYRISGRNFFAFIKTACPPKGSRTGIPYSFILFPSLETWFIRDSRYNSSFLHKALCQGIHVLPDIPPYVINPS